MSVTEEIMQMEERLRQAELGPDPQFFEEALDDDAVLDGQRGMKSKVVEAHRPDGTAKFTEVTMSDFVVIEHGAAAVVTCMGTYVGPKGTFTLKFMRVWVKKAGKWKIVAGTVSQ
jgi:hypothetical protein